MKLLGSLMEKAFKLSQKLNVSGRKPAIIHQRKVLFNLLSDASFTAFGKHYHFDELLYNADFVKAYQDAVPIFDYDKMHREWWYRALEKEENVSWPGKIQYFALSSGTSGAPSKYLPITKEMLRHVRKSSIKSYVSLSNFNIDPSIFAKSVLLLGGSTALTDKGDYFIGDLSGINIKNAPLWVRWSSHPPGKEITGLQSWEDRLAEIAKNAREWDVAILTGLPAWNQLMMERVIEHHGVSNIHEIWPNLSVYIHGGVAMEPYKRTYEQMMAKPLLYIDTYLASEGFVAFQNRPNAKGMAMLLNNGAFYEFVPFNDDNFDEEGRIRPHAKALTIAEVDTHTDYALLMSTCSGAWRYLIGDTVRFTDIAHSEIIITGRTKHFLSICGEHLSVDNMNQALSHLQETLSVNVPEFMVAGVAAEGYFTHHWYIGCKDNLDDTQAAHIIDEYLKSINDDYATERSAVLKDIKVFAVPLQVFYDWMERNGKMGGQHKFPRVMRGEQLADWESFVKDYTNQYSTM